MLDGQTLGSGKVKNILNKINDNIDSTIQMLLLLINTIDFQNFYPLFVLSAFCPSIWEALDGCCSHPKTL